MKLYSTGCPKCIVIEEFLKEKKIKYEKCEDEEVMRSKGFTSLPILEVEETYYDFFKALNYVKGL